MKKSGVGQVVRADSTELRHSFTIQSPKYLFLCSSIYLPWHACTFELSIYLEEDSELLLMRIRSPLELVRLEISPCGAASTQVKPEASKCHAI